MGKKNKKKNRSLAGHRPTEAFGASRKRQLAEISFVYPRTNGRKPYSFGNKQAEEPVASEQTSTRKKSTEESLRDILDRNSNKNGKRDNNGLSGVSSVEDVVRDKHGCRPRANSTDGELNLPQRGLCEERLVLERYRWQFGDGATPKGLINLGNTCFLNSTLQCLAHLPPFCQSLMSLADQMNGSGKASQGKKFTQMMSSFCTKFHSGKGDSMAPRQIVSSLPSLGSCGSRSGYKFRPGRQEDAHEFLLHLLDSMHDGELRQAGINQHQSGWRDRLPIPRLDETTFIHRVFGGYLRSQVRCTKCNYRSNTYDPFLDLSLEVSKKSCHSMYVSVLGSLSSSLPLSPALHSIDAISEFTRKETLDSENRWQCSGCKKRVRATKQLTVFRPPLSLCIQLKRFTFGGSPFGFMGGRGGKKISKPIDFPETLRLPLSDGRSCSYSLTGIVIHVGGSAHSGHYTACVKRPGSANGDGSWFHMDDSFVQGVSQRSVLKQNDAYLLFYCRQEVKLEFPTPPLRSSMSAQEAVDHGRVRARARAASLDMSVDTTSSATRSESEKAEEASTDSGASATAVGETRQVESKPTVEVAETRQDRTDTPTTRKTGEHISLSDKPAEPAHASNSNNEANNEESESDSSSSDSDSSGSSSSSSSDSSSVSDADRNATNSAPSGTEDATPSKGPTKIVLDRGAGREKIEVMMGPRYKSSKPMDTSAGRVLKKEGNLALLGNRPVERWDEDEAVGDSKARDAIVGEMNKKETQRKRKMHTDRWDSLLDQGKTKKTKSKQTGTLDASDSRGFQRIQASLQRMNRGKAKGAFRQDQMNGKHKQHRFSGKNGQRR